MNKTAARELLRQFNFKSLFLDELGWDDYSSSLHLKVGEETVTLDAVAEKRGMAAYLCSMPGEGQSYDYPMRCKIESQLARSVREHLVIYTDSDQRFQTWQWVKREPGKPIARREHTLTAGQSGEALLQKLEALEVTIEEEEQLTLVGITARARQAFDVDRVTKRFYDRFKTEHAAFLKQIAGIADKDECGWYASIMFNRLKFVYFIQKKGFLDNDTDYLRNRLKMIVDGASRPVSTSRDGSSTTFLSFYRDFLLKLFHDGLGHRERSPDLCQLLGTVPYLNGGIFAVHPLEEKYPDIDIPDKAFEKVFDFFDQYRWHLDERPLRADNEINPDVLGYIFEKYINQKQIGACYKKEDIIEYISKNCIVPFILDRVEADLKKKPDAFRALFQLLAADTDRYIYHPVKHGVDLPLPPEIEKGLDTQEPNLLERRAEWNKAAPSEYALPTEIWREVVARRQRCADLRTRLSSLSCSSSTSSGSSSSFSSNDLITLNLDIRQFAQDCIENAATPDVLWAFWQAIEQITVLDPTCGSGAFLFAALNILEPLYEACLDRMKVFMLEWSQAARVPHPNYYKDFAAVIARVEKHANEKYFIFKSIIIRNLYGVDIMDEAVEICKLRLFLKLAAQLEPDYSKDNLGIEPLPDIDFNIRAGNTLVGFATEKQAEDVIRQDLLAYNTVWPEVQKEAQEIAEMFALFRQQQTELGGAVSASDKKLLRNKLAPLEERLNAYMAGTYGVNVDGASRSGESGTVDGASRPVTTSRDGSSTLADWVHSHKPFHWFIEFYEIMAKGGFDVIIGNPPYVEYSKMRDGYSLPYGIYRTESCGNIYSFVVERCTTFGTINGRQGFILPTSSISTERMDAFQKLLLNYGIVYSTYGFRPSKLFEGATSANIHLSILLLGRLLGSASYALHHIKWNTAFRPYLFQTLSLYTKNDPEVIQHFKKLPRLASHIHLNILRKIMNQSAIENAISPSIHRVYYRTTGGLHYRVFTVFPTESRKESGVSFKNQEFCDIAFCGYASNLWNMFYYTFSNCLDVARFEVNKFPLGLEDIGSPLKIMLIALAKKLDNDLRKNAHYEVRHYKDQGDVQCYTIEMRDSKPIIDEIDKVLAKHYGFTEEELDFIINYDIKYRMGRSGGEEE